jgi:hypothetical protein
MPGESAPEFLAQTFLADLELKFALGHIKRRQRKLRFQIVGEHRPGPVSGGKFAFLRRIEAVCLHERLFLSCRGSNGLNAFDAAGVVAEFFGGGLGAVKHPPPHWLFFPAVEFDQVSKNNRGRAALLVKLRRRVQPRENLGRQYWWCRWG